MFVLKLIIRNTFRHPLRSLLTVAGVAIAVIAFGLLRTLVELWYLGAESSSATRLVTRSSISLVFSLPISYRDKIRQVSGVTKVANANWFGGIYKSEKNFFPNFAVSGNYLDLYPEFMLSDDERKAFLMDRKGVVAGRKLALKQGWKIGDQITLKGTIFPGQWDFVLRGIYRGSERTTDESQFFFHWDYLNETLKKTMPRRADQTGIFLVGVKRPEQAAEVAQAVDDQFRNSLAETLTETEKAFQLSFVAMTEAIVIAIQIVSYVVIVIIMVVAANTMAMTARERISEYATLKTLGFGTVHIAGVIFGESFAISLAGGMLGIAATFPAAHWIETELSQFFPVFQVTQETVLLDLAAAATVGIIAGIFPTWRGATIKVADGLRRIG
ncbi:FtsX-like permease family protein [Geobacter pelophilus]|uniref:FtsX-like permease family protein n=1 Tax=Geoanaerobacter pelophilus TaxID=60036 RepID=A0AAW4L419_9BACT|nr:FtsX-like permease family protein [Geoanaerobacter pelophilus]MBT0665489.1 FtsX-like permease family protein [Geoanaerobacter pelophilus]